MIFTHVDTKPMSQEVAKEFRLYLSVPRERSLKTSRLSALRAEIDAGTICAFKWAVGHLPNGAIYRVNGNHTSFIFAEGYTVPPGCTALIEHYDCLDMEDITKLWGLFDPVVSTRNSGETASVYADSVPELVDIGQRVIALAVSALSLDIFGPASAAAKGRTAKNVLKAHSAFVVFLDKCMKMPPKEHNHIFRRSGVAIGILRTWRVEPLEAELFWGEVADGSGSDPKSGSRLLRDFLISHGCQEHGVRANRTRALPWDDFTKYCIQAWNCWRKGSTMTTLRLLKEIPKAL